MKKKDRIQREKSEKGAEDITSKTAGRLAPINI